MAKMSKTKLASQGSKIMAEAKKIRKAHPGKKWTACVAQAGKNMKK
jgi:hypothetical protein